jgi:hypothetical protein
MLRVLFQMRSLHLWGRQRLGSVVTLLQQSVGTTGRPACTVKSDIGTAILMYKRTPRRLALGYYAPTASAA